VAAGGLCACTSVTYYQSYFNVDTMDVMERLKATAAFWRASPTFLDLIGDSPDLYGPFWVRKRVTSSTHARAARMCARVYARSEVCCCLAAALLPRPLLIGGHLAASPHPLPALLPGLRVTRDPSACAWVWQIASSLIFVVAVTSNLSRTLEDGYNYDFQVRVRGSRPH